MMIRRYLSHCIFFSQIIVSTAFVHQPTLFYPSASKSQYQKSYHLLTNNSNSNSGAISNPLRFKPQSNPCILNASESDEDKLDSFKDDIASKFSYDRYDNMGVFSPIAEKLDGLTGDWALSYADLSPATPRTFAGVSFLLTNVCYAFAGISLISQGDFFYGALIEIAGIISFWYHFSQLEFGKERNEVRLALLTDYFTAGAALITGGVYMIQMGVTSVPIDALITGAGSIVAISLCWVWEFGYPYLVFHSIWHILSAYTGYLVGQAHIDTIV